MRKISRRILVMSRVYGYPIENKGVYDLSGFNDLDMRVIFAMTPEYNDDDDENRLTEVLLNTSLREIDCSHLNYTMADYTLLNMHLIIDNNEVECVDGFWRELHEFYFDKATRIAFKISNTIDESNSVKIEKLYLSGGSSVATRINKFLKINDIHQGPVSQTL